MNEQEANELMKKYFELQQQVNNIETDMTMLKNELMPYVEKECDGVFVSPHGEARQIVQHREKFDAKLAKTYLSETQIANCTSHSEVSFIQIMSKESLDNRKKFLKRGA